MDIQVSLRCDQNLLTKVNSPAWICAPDWTSSYLKVIWRKLRGYKLVIQGTFNSTLEVTVSDNVDLRQLEQIARNEAANVSGSINFRQYGSLGIPCILSLKDFARHCVIVGMDRTTHYGGYPSAQRIKQNSPVIVCDLAALQFQSRYNTGRHVVIQKHPTEKGLYDEEYFQSIIKEKKMKYEEISDFQRYTKVNCKIFGLCYFDSIAYLKFVQHDVTFSLLAVTTFAESNNIGSIVFRFLKYGTGFYSGDFGNILEHLITLGVIKGIENFCRMHTDRLKLPGRIELPFFHQIAPESSVGLRVSRLLRVHKIPVVVTNEDCLNTGGLKWGSILATTNCGDSHSPFGNEMNFGSVDAAIAENLESKGNTFSPSLNAGLSEHYLHA